MYIPLIFFTCINISLLYDAVLRIYILVTAK